MQLQSLRNVGYYRNIVDELQIGADSLGCLLRTLIFQIHGYLLNQLHRLTHLEHKQVEIFVINNMLLYLLYQPSNHTEGYLR